MNMLMKFTVLGVSLMLSVWACANNNGNDPSARCDHKEPKTFNVKVIVGKDQSKKPRVDKKTVVACFDDDIVFDGEREEGGEEEVNFEILFKNDSPFEKNLSSSRGKANGKVKANPRGKQVVYEYGVKVPGYPELDPKIVIAPR